MTVTLHTMNAWDIVDSYGLIACQLARQFRQRGIEMAIGGKGRQVHPKQPEDIQEIVSSTAEPSQGGIFFCPIHHMDLYGDGSHGEKRLAITMCETGRIPDNEVRWLNQMDAIVTPSDFCAMVFEQCGVRTPITVAPLGLGDLYQPIERTDDRPLTFLAFLDRGKRKGGMVALQAFLHAFGDNMDYHFILKGRKARVPFTLTNENMTVIQEDYTEQQMMDLYARCDVMICPTAGEGFGLLPREFAATGGIALATGWSAACEQIDEWGWKLPYTLEISDYVSHPAARQEDRGYWAKPDREGITTVLRGVDEYIAHYRRRMKVKSERVRELYRWSDFANTVYQQWQRINA